MSKLSVIIFFGVIFAACAEKENQRRTTCLSKPKIISRKEWGARAPNDRQTLAVNPPPFVFIHHSVGKSCTTKKVCEATVKKIQNNHMDKNQWSDIGYNFLIGEDGNVYEGCGWGTRGAHSPKYNAKSVGICFIGTFTHKLPGIAALDAAKKLLAYGVSKGKITADYTLLGHRQATATTCPGDDLYELIKTWPHWKNIQI